MPSKSTIGFILLILAAVIVQVLIGTETIATPEGLGSRLFHIGAAVVSVVVISIYWKLAMK